MAPGLLAEAREPLSLNPATVVDVARWRTDALAGAVAPPAQVVRELMGMGELLPGWYEDWVLFEREQLRQLRLTALDQRALQLLEEGDLALALTAAQCCVALEPYRESTHRTLVRVHLAAGNRIEALRVYLEFRQRSLNEFGLVPDPAFTDLVAPLLHEQQHARRRAPTQVNATWPPGRATPA